MKLTKTKLKQIIREEIQNNKIWESGIGTAGKKVVKFFLEPVIVKQFTSIVQSSIDDYLLQDKSELTAFWKALEKQYHVELPAELKRKVEAKVKWGK